jgi:tetratricopeptide (TPR) repeat protein
LTAAHNNLGLVLRRKNQLGDAIAAFRTAIDLNPKDAQIYFDLGLAQANKRDWDEAIAAYRKAIAVNPKFAAAYHMLGYTLATKNQLDDAIAEYNKAIAIEPKNAGYHYHLGQALQAQNRLDDAVAEYKKAIEIDPRNVGIRRSLGSALRAENRLDDAIAEYKKIIEIDPKNALTYDDLGGALAANNQLDDAVAAYKKAIDIQPKNSGFHQSLVPVLLRAGLFAEATVYSERLLKLLPEDAPFRRFYVLQRERCDRLLVMSPRLADLIAGKVAPADNRERLDLAYVCYYQKRYVAATRLFGEAFAADVKLTDDFTAWYHDSAACCAALAAAGQGLDGDKLDDNERTRLRQKALGWLRADLDLYRKQLETGKAQDRTLVQEALREWQKDSDLASIRDKDAVAKLPAGEKEAWEKLWAEVAELLQKAAGSK